MKTKIDIQTWVRKEYYEHFGKCDDPYFGITTTVDCTTAYETCKQHEYSFFIYYMYKSIKTINQIENFRYRIINQDIWLYDHVHASTTIGRPDGTFGFALFKYTKNFTEFHKNAKTQIANVQNTSGLRANNDAKRLDVIHYTTLPWFSFTSFRHEKNFTQKESIPKIAFGKYYDQQNKKHLPLSINANHGLLDGYHIAKYLELFQQELDKKL
ncbi:MAG: chloramphenicol acetyltransferase [Candidatus Bathyarchaeota archaeon]|nr:chloramphenicol acetyltransferase [Candidatus Termiticorpusculum sp.]